MAEDRVLEEIRDLLKEQNRLVAELKAQNELALQRQAEQVAKAEALGQKTIVFGASVIGQLAR